MSEFSAPRIIIKEKQSDTINIRPASVGAGVMYVRTRRGPTKSTRIVGPGLLRKIYGDDDANTLHYAQGKAFFANGGSVLHLCRILGSSGGSNTAASAALSANAAFGGGRLVSDAGSFPAALADGDTFTGEVDGGAAATLTINAKRAARVGSGATYAAVAASSHLDIQIPGANGGAVQVIVFAGTENSQALYLAAVNAALLGGSAINSGGQFRIQTDKKGTTAAGAVVASSSASVLAALGLTAAAFTADGSSNVADVDAVTAPELAALMNGVFTGSSSSGSLVTNQLTWASNTTGPSSSVKFNSGTGIAKIAGFDTVLHSGSASSPLAVMTATANGPGSDGNRFSVVPTSQDSRIASSLPALVPIGVATSVTLGRVTASRLAAGDTIRLVDSVSSASVRGTISVVQGDKVTFEVAPNVGTVLPAATTSVFLETFSLTVLYDGEVIMPTRSGLRMSPLSLRNYYVKLFDPTDPETLVNFSSLNPAPSNLDLRPVGPAGGIPLGGGLEATVFTDADYIGDPALKTGLYAIDRQKEPRMACIPGVTGDVEGAVSRALIDYCEQRETMSAIVGPPSATTTPVNHVEYANRCLGTSSYAWVYGSWGRALSALTGLNEFVPCEGYVMGMIARSISQFGIHEAPAGDIKGRLLGLNGVSQDPEEAERDLLYENNINPIELDDSGNVLVMGSRTRASGDFNQIHVRQTFIYLRVSLKTGMRFVLFSTNDTEGRAAADRAATAFLDAEWRKGTLSGDLAEEAYSVQVDEDNNPDSLVKQNIMQMDLGVNIPGTVENLLINLSPATRPATGATT